MPSLRIQIILCRPWGSDRKSDISKKKKEQTRRNPTSLDWNQPHRGIDSRSSEERPEISSLNLSFSRTRSPLPESNKYSISFSARSVASCRSVHCLWAHLTHAALVPARVLGSAAWGCPETRMIIARHFTTINEYTTRNPNRKGTRKKSLPRSRISNKVPPLATA